MISLNCLENYMHDWLDQYEYSISSTDTGELAGDPLELATGINEDLHLLYGELVGVLNLGCGFTIEIGRRLDVEGIICPEVFSILKYHFWIAHAFHSSIAAEALAGGLAAQREPSACVSATFVVEKNQSWSIWHGVGQVSLRWVTLSSTSMRFVRIWEMSSDCHVRRGIWFVSVEMIIWFLGTFRVMNRRIKYSLMKSLDIKQVSYLSAWVSDPVLSTVSLLIIRSAGRRSDWGSLFCSQIFFVETDACLGG